MKWYIFKAPYKPGDVPLEKLNYEPNEFIIGQKAIKYGSIIIKSEDDLKKEGNI